jgi:hypothetical protein
VLQYCCCCEGGDCCEGGGWGSRTANSDRALVLGGWGGLEKLDRGRDRRETFFTDSGSDRDSDETFQISRNLGLELDEFVCLLDSQPWIQVYDLQKLNNISVVKKFRFVDLNLYGKILISWASMNDFQATEEVSSPLNRTFCT